MNLYLKTAKSTIIICCLFILQTAVFAQSNIRITIKKAEITLQNALIEVERQSKLSVAYNQSQLSDKRQLSLNIVNQPLETALKTILKGTGFFYKLTDKYIMIVPEKKETNSQETKTVKGKIVDEKGEPLIGVNVKVKGTTTGAITDFDGNFQIQAKKGAILEVSYIGYSSQEIKVTDSKPLSIMMMEDTKVLNEVVVTALGIKRVEKALSYNVQQVSSDELTTVKDVNFLNSLNGKVAGLNINSSSSGIGGASKVVMRGSRSIEKSSNALYVIDGVPVNNASRDKGNVTENPFDSGGSSDMIADINPEDIESISVLSGAAAAALYGSSAANGAILITTKKGSVDKTTITVSQNTEFSRPFVTPDFQNKYGTSLEGGQTNRSWGPLLNSYNYTGYNPIDDYLKTGVTTTESISVSTGNTKNQTYLSASMVNNKGMVPNNKYNRYNFSFRNTTSLFNDKMTLDIGASYIKQDDRNMIAQGTYSNPLVSAYLYPRSNDWNSVKMFETYDDQRKIYTQNWDMDPGGYLLQNPYWVNYRNLRDNQKQRYMFNAGLSYDVFDWLSISGRVNVDNSEEKGTKKYYASTVRQLTELSDNGWYGESSQSNRQIYADAMLNINKTFNEDWSLNATLGASLQDVRADGRSISGPIRDGSIAGETALPSNVFNLYQISNAKTKKSLTGWREQMQSVFASAEVGYKGTYYLTATMRTDWPSQLAGPESVQSSFTYPSVGFSVVLSEALKLPEQISYLKVRGSYANVGLAFPRFLANPTKRWLTSSNEWSEATHMPVSNLKPEYTHSYELGLTAKFLNHFNVDFTWYNTNTIDQLFNPGISPGSGYESMYVQRGDVRNRGIELSLGYDNKWNDFGWGTSFTFSTNQNKIMKLAGEVEDLTTGEKTSYSHLDIGGLGDVHFLLKEGGSLGDIYSSLDLVRDSDGKIFVDNNGNVALDKSNKGVDQWHKLGSVFSKANMSWRNDFSWKGINMGFLVTARLGGVVYSRTQVALDYHGVSEASAIARDKGGYMVNGGDMVNAYNWYDVVASGDGVPQYYTYDATNIRLQEASIGYTIPRKWLKNVCDITVSLVGRNLLMIYKKAPFDPESVASAIDNYYQGIDFFMMPSARNIGFSTRIKF